jgi:hypothetical protein
MSDAMVKPVPESSGALHLHPPDMIAYFTNGDRPGVCGTPVSRPVRRRAKAGWPAHR